MPKGKSKATANRVASKTIAVGGEPSDKSISGRPWNEKDLSTWNVGTEIMYHMGDDLYSVDDVAFTTEGGWHKGVVREVHDDHLIVDVPIYSDHLWIDKDSQDHIRATKSGALSANQIARFGEDTTIEISGTKNYDGRYTKQDVFVRKGTNPWTGQPSGTYVLEWTKVGTRTSIAHRTQESFFEDIIKKGGKIRKVANR